MAEKTQKTRDRSPVAEMNIWAECLQKERANQKINENFTINPRKLFVQSEKPNNNIMLQKKMQEQKSSTGNPFHDIEMNSRYTQQESPELESELLTKLSSISQVPKTKYKFPQTANQELGWYNQESKNMSPDARKNNKFTYPRNMCPETVYANQYFKNQRFSPFSNKTK